MNLEKKHYKYSICILIIFLFIACKNDPQSGDPKLSAQPGIPNLTATKGLNNLELGGEDVGFLYVPENYSKEIEMPLMVALHGAGGSSSNWKNYFDYAEERNMIFVALDSRASTWDLIIDDYGDDVKIIDKALKYVFSRCTINANQLAICGFSDGATYALSLGISNGDLFSHLIGYSPGYVINVDSVGKPKIYISHGDSDSVLPVEGTREYIVPTFNNMGYDVTYYEFRGGHTLPSYVSNLSIDWFLGTDDDNAEDEAIM